MCLGKIKDVFIDQSPSQFEAEFYWSYSGNTNMKVTQFSFAGKGIFGEQIRMKVKTVDGDYQIQWPNFFEDGTQEKTKNTPLDIARDCKLILKSGVGNEEASESYTLHCGEVWKIANAYQNITFP